MSIESRRLSLIDWIIHLKDEQTLEKIESLQTETVSDWHKTILDEQTQLLEKGKLKTYSEEEAFNIIGSDEE
jgi:hypothetical protein